MGVVWTTFAIVFLLMPGVAFLFGFYSPSRYSRDTANHNALGDLALTLFVTVVLHVVAVILLEWVEPNVSGLTLTARLVALPLSLDAFHNGWTGSAIEHFKYFLIYTLVLTSAGYLAGRYFGSLVVKGPLRFLARHRWIYDVIEAQRKNRGFVVAYVLSKLKEGDKLVMYRGHLDEFYFSSDGTINYLILKNCYRYYMVLEGEFPKTTYDLESGMRALLPHKHNVDKVDAYYMMIEGSEISNVVFERTRGIKKTTVGEKQLDDALQNIAAEIVEKIRKSY